MEDRGRRNFVLHWLNRLCRAVAEEIRYVFSPLTYCSYRLPNTRYTSTPTLTLSINVTEENLFGFRSLRRRSSHLRRRVQAEGAPEDARHENQPRRGLLRALGL